MRLARRFVVAFERRLARILNGVFRRYSGGHNRAVFYDVEGTFPELQRIDENYDVIRDELMGVLPGIDQMRRYHEVDSDQNEISGDDERAWRVFFPLRNEDRCPQTSAVVRSIPNVLQAFFSILEPSKSVPAHCGPGMHYLRYHTAFVVPTGNPPTIRVKDRHYTWKEGESLFFDDSWEHEVTNDSDGIRVVLITDVMRPMPWPLHQLNRFWRSVRRTAQRGTKNF